MTTSDNISAIEAIEKAMEGVTPCGYQRRPRYEHRSSTVSGTPWALCGWEEATDMFRREPRFEYRPIYDRETILAEARKAEAMKQRAEAAEALAERLKREAQGHAMEARTANATIHEIYQCVSGASGEPGNWNGAEPVREKLEAMEREIAELREAAKFAVAALETLQGYEADLGDELLDDYEIGRIEDSRHSPSFRIRVGHIRRLARTLLNGGSDAEE